MEHKDFLLIRKLYRRKGAALSYIYNPNRYVFDSRFKVLLMNCMKHLGKNAMFYVAISIYWLLFMKLILDWYNKEFFLVASITSTFAVNFVKTGGLFERLIKKKH